MIVDELLIAFGTKGADKSAKEVDKIDAKIKAAKKNFEKYEKQLAKTGKEATRLKRDAAAKLISSLEAQARAARKAEKRIAALRKGYEGLKNTARGMDRMVARGGALALAGGGAAAVASAVDVGSRAREVKHLSEVLSLSTTALQGFEYAAKRSGMSTDHLRMGIQDLNKKIQEVAISGDSTVAGLSFRSMGVDVKELAKLQPEKQLYMIAAALEKLEGSAAKNTFMSYMMGEEAGPRFVEFFKGGERGLRIMAQEAKNLGAVLTEEEIARGVKFNKALVEAKTAAKGLSYSIGLELIPEFKGLIDQFKAWTLENKELIRTKAAEYIEKIAPVVKDLARSIPPLLELLGSFVSTFASMPDWMKKVAVGAGAVSLAFGGMIGPILGITSAIKGLVAIMPALGLSGGAGGLAGLGGMAAGLASTVAPLAAVVGAGAYAGHKLYKLRGAQTNLRDTSEQGLAIEDILAGRKVSLSTIQGMSKEDVEDSLSVMSSAIVNQGYRTAALKKELRRLEVTGGSMIELSTKRAAFQGSVDREANLQRSRERLEDRMAQINDLPEEYSGTRSAVGDVSKLVEADKRKREAEAKAKRKAKSAKKQGGDIAKTLRDRRMRGTPPAVNVTIHNNGTNVQFGDFIVKAPRGADGPQMMRLAASEFEGMFERVVQRNAKKGSRQGA